MNDFWNERYNTEEFAYGEKPNEFVKQQLPKLKPGKALFPAEGEGRNAVFAATIGWEVTAFDPSTEGKRKAELLANKKKVEIEYQIAGYEDVDFAEESFDCIVLTYTHMPAALRKVAHKKFARYLKTGGTLILEAFSETQINYNTGGPQNIDFLFSKENLEADFTSFSKLEITELDTILDEGRFHQGKSAIIRCKAVK